MNKKDIFFILLPCFALVILAGALLFFSNRLSPEDYDQKQQRIQQDFEDLVRKVQSGEAHPKTADLVEVIGNSYRREKETHQFFVTAFAQQSRNAGYGILALVALQVGLVIWRKRAATR